MRKKSLYAKKIGKFIVYTLGEIVLIVIGILLAVKVADLNDARKEETEELKILKSLNRDLDFNTENLEELIEMDSLLVLGNEYLLKVVRDANSSYSSELDELFGSINRYSIFFPQRMAYESLKAQGVNLIKNDSLRSAIINLYDYEYMTNDIVELELKRGLYENTNVVFLRHLDTGEEVYLKKPRDFAALKRDQEFVNHLAHITAEQKLLTYFTSEHLFHTVSVNTLIEKEIKRLESE